MYLKVSFIAPFISIILVFYIFLDKNKYIAYSTHSNKDVVLLWWTDRIYPHFEDKETIINCKRGSCITSNKKELKHGNQTIGFLFYGTDLEIENMPLPRTRNHVWALIHEESPMNNYLFSHTAGIEIFNYTSTFRRESDYPLTSQFLPSIEYLTERKPISLSIKNILRKNHLAPVLYIQSHCEVASDRDRYVKELSKYIEVDSYGTCLKNKSLPPELSTTDKYDSSEFFDFIAQYKFHLAFENAICDDYITEKLFRAMHVGSIPVYKGSPTVKEWSPSNKSVIVVDDFDSPEKLAIFIKGIDSDDSEYSSYLEYKNGNITNNFLVQHLKAREWGVNEFEKIDFFRGFECFLCDKLLEQSNFTDGPSDLNPVTANKNHMGCTQPYISVGSEAKLSSSDKWLQQAWIDSYWYAYDLARALKKIIQDGGKSSADIHQIALSMRYEH